MSDEKGIKHKQLNNQSYLLYVIIVCVSSRVHLTFTPFILINENVKFVDTCSKSFI